MFLLARLFNINSIRHSSSTREFFANLKKFYRSTNTVEPRYNEEVGNIRQKFQEIRFNEVQLVNSVKFATDVSVLTFGLAGFYLRVYSSSN